jgi:exonuclease VII large subunit
MVRLAKRRRSLDELRLRLLQQGEQIAPPCRRKLTRLATSLRVAARSGRLTAHHQQRFAYLDGALRAFNPRAALARGYSIIRSSTTGRALNSSVGVVVGEHLEVVLAEGGLDVVVEQVQEHTEGRR